jgi:hypothetical protein
MRRSVRNALLAFGCLLVIGGAGAFAVSALNGANTADDQPVTTALRVVQNDAGGIAKLTTVAPMTLGSGATLPAGTAVTVPSVTLTASMQPATAPAIGATLRCDLTVNWGSASPVIDIVTCAPATVTRTAN